MKTASEISQEEWDTCIKVLRALSKNPEEAKDLMVLKGLVTRLYKNAKKEGRRKEQKATKIADEELLSQTVLHQLNPLEAQEIPQIKLPTDIEKAELKQAQNCYCCKTAYKKVHFFYHLLCPACAALNYEKRTQRADLKGRTALITGGRVKIGYLTALQLLRDGATVLLTTRFPKDAARRFSEESDFSSWQSRLKIYGLDLRNIASVEHFIAELLRSLPALDIIINNAAQTIKRPWGYYQHLIEAELQPTENLPEAVRALLPAMSFDNFQLLEYNENQLGNAPHPYFPVGQFDKHQQQIDLRPENSWVLKLEEVDTVEMLEVQLVNTLAPFLFNSKLKPLLLQSPFSRKFIINVSAMEGQFNRKNKTPFHPHTNMAKAALNMLTRTSAEDYAKSGIYMNSVDTGWITQENPFEKKQRIRSKGFVTPLDEVDGMARIYDPIAQALNSSEAPLFGHFLKDYQPYPW